MLSYSIRTIIIGYAIAIVVVLLILLFTFFNLRSQERELVNIKKAREVMQKLEPGLLDIQDFESNLNDLLFFGKEKYKDSYTDDLKELQNDSTQLSEFANSFPENANEYRQLSGLIHEMISFSSFAVQLHGSNNPVAPDSKWQKNSGTGIVTAFKAIVNKLEDKNRKILSDSYGLTIGLSRKIFSFVTIISGVLIFALLISFRVSYRDIITRLNYNRDLAKEVKEKTAVIQASEFNNRLVIENKILGIAWASPDGKVLNANHTFCEMLGYTLNELKGIHFSDFSHPDEVTKELELIRNIEKGAIDSYQIEKRYLNKDGNYFWVELNLTCYRNPGTNLPEYFIGIVQNIQDKKIAEEALKRSEKNLRYVLSSTADIFYVIDRNYRITLINEIAERNLAKAWGKKVTLGSNILDVIPPADDEPIKHNFEKVFKGERIEYEINHTTSNLPAWVQVNYMPVIDEDGAIIGAYVVSKEITERKIAEKAIRESEERYRSVIEQASDYIMITDIKGDFIDVNSSLCNMFGYSREELLGMNIISIIDPRQLKSDPIQFDLLVDGKPILRERRMMKKDGTIVEVEANVKMLQDNRILAIARDITERKQTEEALVNNELRFRTLTSNAPVGIFETDVTGKTTYVNETWRGYTGLTLEEALGDGWIDAVHPDDRERLSSQWYAKAAKGLESTSEYRLIDKKGNIKWVSGKAVPLFNKSGEITGHMGTLSDVTERRKAEEVIRESEERYRALVENAPEALVVMDVEKNTFITVSESAVRLFKMSREELLETGPVAVSPEYQPDGRLSSELAMEKIQEAVSGGKPSFEWTHLDKEGNLIPCEVWLVRLPAENRILIRGSIIDITERKKAEEEITKARELSDKMIDSLPGIFYLYDRAGKFIRWNKQLEFISGYNSKEVADMHPIDFFEGDEKNYITKRIEGVFVNGFNDAEANFVTKDKKKIPFYFKAILVNYEDEPCLLGYGFDISDRKKAEEELERSYRSIRQLTEHLQNIREEERTHIAREIHDELGQRLTVLKMDVSWLNKKINKVVDDSVKQKMKELLEMLDGTVITVRRISSELRPSLLDDLGLVAAIEWQLSEFEKRSGIKTSFTEFGDDVVLSDAVKTGLFRIFQESLTNVARHANATQVKVSLHHKNNSFILHIADNGKGFDKDRISHKRTLGLLGMKERTSMIGGNYDIISEPGRGTTVAVTIPLMISIDETKAGVL